MMYLVDDVESAVGEIARERAAVGAASPESGPIASTAIDVGFDIDHPQVLRDAQVIGEALIHEACKSRNVQPVIDIIGVKAGAPKTGELHGCRWGSREQKERKYA